MAYGARLESVLGESPRGFESPILRRKSLDRTGRTFVNEKSAQGSNQSQLPSGPTLVPTPLTRSFAGTPHEVILLSQTHSPTI